MQHVPEKAPFELMQQIDELTPSSYARISNFSGVIDGEDAVNWMVMELGRQLESLALQEAG
jgi:hypothetical protein